ncbi:LysR family transcriptional regulator [Rhodococcus sp. WB1]|uniref:LysR substrate-binding domain-containing protein n=1 Tax=Rhodococcus TaxID=1827 RepID=UPI00081A8BF6|nr:MULTISPECIES: LysR substrate-binding domain-containing protein [unclassified Rhodococcus (in: high G+C Gram-positive bacteria)]ANZ25557.1 LysR family transcriptional regulator [Rhodococcus sp. WB1]USC17598.1 LysR family transcriptional regulator [Rhodococcus sp. 11-3]
MERGFVPPVDRASRLLDRIRLRHLTCFVAVAQEGNLGRAAGRLHLSQPAVTKTLNELESLAGLRLVDRGRHGARLTPAGEEFLGHAVEVTDALASAARALSGTGQPAVAPVRVGALPTVASTLLPGAVTRLRDRRPHVGVQIRTAPNAALLGAVRAGELDFVLGRMADPETMQGLSFELLYAESLALIVRPGHPLAGGPVSVPAVLNHPLVVATAGTVPRHHTEGFLARHGLRLPSGSVETLDVSVARGLVRAGDAVWLTPERVPQDDLDDGTLVRLPVPTPGTAEPVGLLRRSSADTPVVADELIGILRELAVG